jgi:hypothetical protein
MDELIELSSPNNYGLITAENLLKGILVFRAKHTYTAPIAVTLNVTNIHFLTVFHFTSNQHTLYAVDDGRLSEFNVNFGAYHIVGAMEVIHPTFTDDVLMEALQTIYNRDYTASVPIHEINFDVDTKRMSIRVLPNTIV